MMIRSLRRGAAFGAAALALTVSLAACGGSDNGDSLANTAGDGSAAQLSGTVAGGGSSAQEKAQEAWRAGFGTAHPDVKLSYDSVGSGTGRENFISGAYKYAGSDSAMTSDELASAAKRPAAATRSSSRSSSRRSTWSSTSRASTR